MPPKSKRGKAKSGSTTQPPPSAASTLSTAYIFPGLHDDVIAALSDDGVPDSALPEFNLVGTGADATHTYTSKIQADFQCVNAKCRKVGWGSGVVSIIIRQFPDNSYNAVVYNQRCNGCEELGLMTPNQTYTARVSYRLKKWMGLRMDPPPFEKGRFQGPHESELCEGCKAGVCAYLGQSESEVIQHDHEEGGTQRGLESTESALERLMMTLALGGRTGP